MNNLAMTLFALGKLGEARVLQERTLGAYRRALGPERPETLRSMNNLTFTLRAQNELD